MTREEAIGKINAIKKYLTAGNPIWDVREIDEALNMAIEALQTEAVQDEALNEILGYLDNVLHPIVSPDNWYLYSDLYDMIIELPMDKRGEV